MVKEDSAYCLLQPTYYADAAGKASSDKPLPGVNRAKQALIFRKGSRMVAVFAA